MRYIIYARKSTESEERQVMSIESQLAELKEFAAKEKFEIVQTVRELAGEFEDNSQFLIKNNFSLSTSDYAG